LWLQWIFLYKSCTEMGLITLHYVIFIELFLRVAKQRSYHSHSEQFTNNYTNKIFESINNGHFLLVEEHFFNVVVVYKKNYEVQFEDLPQEVVEFFFMRSISLPFFGHNKIYHKKLILTIFVLQMNIFKDT
jgi:hypothetical protein